MIINDILLLREERFNFSFSEAIRSQFIVTRFYSYAYELVIITEKVTLERSFVCIRAVELFKACSYVISLFPPAGVMLILVKTLIADFLTPVKWNLN